MFDQPLGAPAQNARAAIGAERVKRSTKQKSTAKSELADYSIDRIKLTCRSPRIAVRFMDGETVFTHVPSAPGKPLNIGRALRVSISMYRSRKEVQRRTGFRDYDRAIPVPEIFQVRCLETDELFDPGLCNQATARERQGSSTSATRVVGNSGCEPRKPAAAAVAA
jgi:hypothetical protein